MGKPKSGFKEEPKRFTNTDMERLGIFRELGYISIGEPYKVPKVCFNPSASLGNQMLGPGNKTRDGTNKGYFAPMSTIFAGESYHDAIKWIRAFRTKQLEKNIVKQSCKPSDGEKLGCGLGSYCATINKAPEAFSSLQRPKKLEHEKRNFITNPPQKGTGYGYVPVTIGPYYEHGVEDSINAYREMCKKERALHHAQLRGGLEFINKAYPKDYFTENPYRDEKPVKLRKLKKPEPLKEIQRPASQVHFKIEAITKGDPINPFPEWMQDPLVTTHLYYKEVKGPDTEKNPKTYIPNHFELTMPSNSVMQQNVHKQINVKNFKTLERVMKY